METFSMPIFVILVFAVSVVLLVGSILVLFVLPKREIGKQIPTWAPQAAYAAFMLSLPVVLLLLTMLLFPCLWQICP